MLLDSPDWQSSAEEKRAALQNAYVLCYRQYFDGIPVNAADWHRTITAAEGMAYGSVAPMQEISASVYSNGDYRVFVRNLYEVTGASEKRAVISYGEALSRLADMYSETVLINPNYITEAELCYAVYDKGANNEAVLYPMWIFAVAADTHGTIGAYLKDGTEAAPGYPYGKVSSYGSVYAFDAYTGERIVNIKLRK